jgi:hypothetical protein
MLSLNMFESPAKLRDACGGITKRNLNSFREAFLSNYDNKLAGMPNIAPANHRKLETFKGDCAAGKQDNALRVMIASNVPADFFTRKLRGARDNTSDSFNFYAVSKAFRVANNMLSERPIWGDSSDDNTLRGTIEALLHGKHEDKRKGVAGYLDEYMNTRGKGRPAGTYRNGGTQSSSSAHALSAMGLLLIPSQGAYAIPEGHARGVLRFLHGSEEASAS